MCYTEDTSPVQTPSPFMRVRNVVAVSTAAQNSVKYNTREVQAAALAKQFRERMGSMPFE